jgi:hypothetical protein
MDPRTRLTELKHIWQPPPELQRSRPREVRLTGAGRALLSLAILMLLAAPIIGVLLYVKSTGDHDERRELIAKGIEAQALVTRRWVTTGEHSKRMIEYTYAAEGRTYQSRVELLGPKSWSPLIPGSMLPVRYLPSNPRAHLVPGHEEELMPLWLPFPVSFLMAAIGWLLTRPLAVQRRLLCEGRPTQGIVTGHKKTHQATVAHYTFAVMSGAMARGKVERQKNPPAIGSTICVLYEPDRVQHNRVYPLELFRTARLPLRSERPARMQRQDSASPPSRP